MTTMLVVCVGCSRHVRSTDARCPFCAALVVAGDARMIVEALMPAPGEYRLVLEWDGHVVARRTVSVVP